MLPIKVTDSNQAGRKTSREALLKEEKKKPYPAAEKDSQKLFFGRREEPRGTRPEKSPEKGHEERIQKKQAAGEAEKASMRLEARLRKEPVEEDSVRYSNPQSKAEEKPVQEPKVPEKTKGPGKNQEFRKNNF